MKVEVRLSPAELGKSRTSTVRADEVRIPGVAQKSDSQPGR